MGGPFVCDKTTVAFYYSSLLSTQLFISLSFELASHNSARRIKQVIAERRWKGFII